MRAKNSKKGELEVSDLHAKHVTTIIKTVKRFGKRGAYVYITNKWIGKSVQIILLDNNNNNNTNTENRDNAASD